MVEHGRTMDMFHRTQAWYNSCMTMYKWDLMNLTMLIKGVKHDLIGYTNNVQPTFGIYNGNLRGNDGSKNPQLG